MLGDLPLLGRSFGLIHIHELVCRVYGSLQYSKFFKVDQNNLSSLSTFLISAGTFIIYVCTRIPPLMKMELVVRGFGLFAYFGLFTRYIFVYLRFLGPFHAFLPSTITAI